MASDSDDPTYVDPRGRRSCRRYEVEVPVKVSYDQGRGKISTLSGTIVDISISGARIKMENGEVGGDGRLVNLRFQFFETSTPVTLGARVVRVTEDGLAVQFSSVNHFMRNVIKVAISRLRQRADSGDDTSRSLLGN